MNAWEIRDNHRSDYSYDERQPTVTQPSTDQPSDKRQQRPASGLLLFAAISMAVLFGVVLSWHAYVTSTTTSVVDVIRGTSATKREAKMEIVPLTPGGALPSSPAEIQGLISLPLTPADSDDILNCLAATSDRLRHRSHPGLIDTGILKIKMNGDMQSYVVYKIYLEESSSTLSVIFESSAEGTFNRLSLKEYESEDQKVISLLRGLTDVRNPQWNFQP